jgi:hypothetical protein
MFWIADTGATSHMSPHCKWFVEYHPYCIPVHVANNAVVYSAGISEVVLTPMNPSMNPCCLTCVLYVPELQNNLLSVLHLVANHSFHVEIEGKRMAFYQQGSPRFVAMIRGTMAYMDVTTESITESALASHEPLSCSLWHQHLVHIGIDKIEQVLKHELATGININSDNPLAPVCVPCVHGKHHCLPFPQQASNCASTPFEHIHC